MTPKVFIGLALVTLVTTVAAIVVALERPSATAVHYVDEPAFPALRANPDAVAKVMLTTPEGSFTLVRAAADRWTAPERFDYPVAVAEVRALIVALADMRLIEPKTTRPELYTRLEVEDVAAEDAKSRLVRLEAADGHLLAEAIIGKERQRLTGNQTSGTYMRRPDETQTWLASGAVRLEPGVVDWLDDEIVDLDGERIRRMELQPASGPNYAVGRDGKGEELHLDGLQEGETAKADADFSRLANALSSIRLEDVKPRDQQEWPSEHSTARVTTFDGLQLTVHLAKISDEHWARFDAAEVEPAAPAAAAEPAEPTTDPAAPAEAATAGASAGSGEAGAPADQATADAAESEQQRLTAETLSGRLAPWTYKISEYTYNRLTTARSEWLADKDGTS